MEIVAKTYNTAPGMIETVNGRVLVDNGRSRLMALIEEAYELTDMINVSLSGETPFQLVLGRDMIEGELSSLGDIDLGNETTMLIEQVEEKVFTLTPIDGSSFEVKTLKIDFHNPYEI